MCLVQVIDDQADFYDANAHWMTDAQRAEAAGRREGVHGAGLNKRRGDEAVTFSIDIAGRRIYDGAAADASPAAGRPGRGPRLRAGRTAARRPRPAARWGARRAVRGSTSWAQRSTRRPPPSLPPVQSGLVSSIPAY